LARVEVSGFDSINLVINPQGEVLIASSDQEPGTFCLMLKPHVWVGLGNFNQIPPEP
jgi:hypothetical protein